MIQQYHCWAYTLRKPEGKETRVPRCVWARESTAPAQGNQALLLRLTGNTAHHERDVKLASHLRGLASRASTFAPLATRAVNLQHPWLVRIHLAAQNTEASTC